MNVYIHTYNIDYVHTNCIHIIIIQYIHLSMHAISSYNLNEMSFTTPDNDIDLVSGNCAQSSIREDGGTTTTCLHN